MTAPACGVPKRPPRKLTTAARALSPRQRAFYTKSYSSISASESPKEAPGLRDPGKLPGPHLARPAPVGRCSGFQGLGLPSLEPARTTDCNTACPSRLSASLVTCTATTLKPMGARAAGPKAWMDAVTLHDDASPAEPWLWPQRLPFIYWNVQRAFARQIQKSGHRPLHGLGELSPRYASADDSCFLPDQPHNPLFPLQPPKQGCGPG